MVAEMIQLEEINWSLWGEERNCDAFIRAQSRPAYFLLLLIHHS